MPKRIFTVGLTCLLATSELARANANFQVGNFTKTTSGTVTQTVSHTLGQTPKAIILWTNGKTDQTLGAGYRFGFGLTDGTTSKALTASSSDAVSPSVVGRRIANKAVTIVDAAGTLQAEADLQSWDTTGFTLNWTTNDATATVVHFLAIGGAKISAKVIGWTMPIATGSKTVTGVGFTPDVVLSGHIGAAATGAPPTTSTNGSLGLSWFDAAGDQGSTCSFSQSAFATTSTHRYQRADKASVANSNVLTKEATWTSMDTDGFTLNYTTANASAGQMISLALKGVQARASSFAKATGGAPASQQVTGLSFRPSVLLFASAQDTSSSAVGANARFGFGATDGTTDGSIAFHDADGVGTTSTDGVDKTSKSFVKVNNDTQTIDAEAATTSLDTAGFTLSWTTNDAVATEILYLALAPARRVMVIGSR